jgi:hypothetical protein
MWVKRKIVSKDLLSQVLESFQKKTVYIIQIYYSYHTSVFN